MYKHILIPTDGSELSKLALEEGVALAKALNARVTVVTVTTPFHVISGNPVMLTDTPERYKDHMAADAKQYLDKEGLLRRQPEWSVIWCMLNTSTHIKRLSTLLRIAVVTRYKWRPTDDAGYQPCCSGAKRSRC